jgi:hypothetical protein
LYQTLPMSEMPAVPPALAQPTSSNAEASHEARRLITSPSARAGPWCRGAEQTSRNLARERRNVLLDHCERLHGFVVAKRVDRDLPPTTIDAADMKELAPDAVPGGEANDD